LVLSEAGSFSVSWNFSSQLNSLVFSVRIVLLVLEKSYVELKPTVSYRVLATSLRGTTGLQLFWNHFKFHFQR
jgi:hypothetical protein